MGSDDRAAVLIPLGDFLTAEEPVWVWDVKARRILWANHAGRDFWGAPSQDALRERRFSTQDRAAARIAALLRKHGTHGEWTDALTLASAAGRVTVQCTMQTLELADGGNGLIIRVLDDPAMKDGEFSTRKRQSKTKAQAKAKSAATAQSKGKAQPKTGKAAALSEPSAMPAGDRAALAAIAAQMQAAASPSPTARKTRKSSASKSSPAPAPASAKKSAAASPKPPRKPAPRTSAFSPLGNEAYHMPDALTLMLRELCHELRNPLTVILGFAERIRDSGLMRRNPEKAQSYAGNIVESAELAMEILADFSARVLLPGAGLPQPEPVEIGPIVTRCVQLITPLATQAGLKVSKTAGKTLPRLHISERALKQILLNVLMNAVRHQKTGGKVRVAARKLKDGVVRLTITDDGIGMTKKEIRTALGVSRKSPPPDTEAPGRSGLGLPLVKKLVESTGGTLSIDSVRRKGTTIEILFPSSATVPV
ncbi:MAG: HAMP domain-containing sensor histidine kinase [Alphaproteobacteria bacterium]